MSLGALLQVAETRYRSSARGTAAGANRKPDALTPDGAAGTQEPPQPAGSHAAEPPTGKTTTGTPNPIASATLDQVPDPELRHERAGTSPAGQSEPGNATSAQPGPDAATAWTSAAERRARAAGEREGPTGKT